MIKKRNAIISAVVLSMFLALTGCASGSKDSKGETSQILFNGSSTLAPVVSKIATNFTEENKTWDKVDKSLPKSDITIYVSSGGSGAGIKSVADGTANFGMLARSVKDEEKSKIEGLKETTVGIDALTISVNPKNPIIKVKDNLTSDEVKKIFSGEYKTWNQVDKSLPNKEIVVVTRDIGGGAHEVFQKKVMGDAKVKKDAIQAPSMGALVAKIIENENAIGYASFGVANQNKGKISPLKVDGVEATDNNILNKKYKIQRPLIIINKGEMNAMGKVFMDYIKSEKGTKVIEEMGFIPVK